jgi:hypothetical protein
MEISLNLFRNPPFLNQEGSTMATVRKAVYHNGTLVLEEELSGEAEGKRFTVIVLEDMSKRGDGRLGHFFSLAGNIDLDESAIRRLRERSTL